MYKNVTNIYNTKNVHYEKHDAHCQKPNKEKRSCRQKWEQWMWKSAEMTQKMTELWWWW